MKVSEVLQLAVDGVRVDAAEEYPMAGVYSFGRGLFRRASLSGSGTTYKVLHKLHRDDYVLSQLKAWEGALARVPEEFEGSFLSPQFPTFRVDRGRLDVRFLEWVFRQPRMWEQLKRSSRGMGARRDSVSPKSFLEVSIPLPPLPEQRRIVARLTAVVDRLDDVQQLRLTQREALVGLVVSLHVQLAGSRRVKLGELLELDERQERVEMGKEYPQAGVRSFGAGLFLKGAVTSDQTTYRSFNRLFSGAVVLSQVKGWEGAIAVCPPELEGVYASPEYRTFRCIPAQAHAEYLASLVRTPWFWTQLLGATRGVGARRERTRPERFLQLELPMPERAQQEWAAGVFHRLDQVSTAGAEAASAYKALSPSAVAKLISIE